MQSQATIQKRDAIAAALSRQAVRVESDLHKRPRVFEQVIRFLLLSSGLLSIFTTIGIVVVLGSESLLFLTPPAWKLWSTPRALRS